MPFCSQILSSPTQLAEFADLERTVAWTTPEKQVRPEVFATPEMARRPCTVVEAHPCNVTCSLCPDELGASVSSVQKLRDLLVLREGEDRASVTDEQSGAGKGRKRKAGAPQTKGAKGAKSKLLSFNRDESQRHLHQPPRP